VNAAAYYRVSSKAQDLASQRDPVERAAKNRGDRLTRIYQEKRSARTLDRAELEKLRLAARAGLIKRLYIFRLDRLARSGIRDTLALVQELRAAGVEIVTVADGFDINGPAAEVVLAVMAWAAQMERLATNERISAARVRVEAAGGKWGRPTRMTAQQLQQAKKFRTDGKSLRAIAVAIKVPLATVARGLKGAGA
jgi:DNA invertase Pin-like site-specific DNA recombinase